MQKAYIAPVLAGLILMIPVAAHAELLWTDGDQVKQEFTEQLSKMVSPQCMKDYPADPDNPSLNSVVGYTDVTANPPDEISYEVRLKFGHKCFNAAETAIRRRIARHKPIFSVKVARAVDAYADSGTFILNFKERPYIVDEVSRH